MSNSFALRNRSERQGANGRHANKPLLQRLDPVLQERIRFFGGFLREPTSVGALAPSSQALALAMIEDCNLRGAETVVELGPGTGSFTRVIAERIRRKTRFLALELDPIHARELQREFPRVFVYHDSAENLPVYLGQHGNRKADVIVSGLPWASLPLSVQDRVMQSILSSLTPNGVFTTFAYVFARWMPNAQEFRKRLMRHFDSVTTSPVVWKNLPPAFVYRCAGPKRG